MCVCVCVCVCACVCVRVYMCVFVCMYVCVTMKIIFISNNNSIHISYSHNLGNKVKQEVIDLFKCFPFKTSIIYNNLAVFLVIQNFIFREPYFTNTKLKIHHLF